MRTDSVHVFHADGTYHNSYRHGTTASQLNHEQRTGGLNITSFYSFSDLSGLWSHYRESRKLKGKYRWVHISYEDVPSVIKAQMMLICPDCDTDGQHLNPFQSRK